MRFMQEENVPKGKTPLAAAVFVTVSQDQMQAVLHIDPPRDGGAEMTPGAVDAAVKKAKVRQGLDEELLERIRKAPEYSKNYVIARGRPAEDGKNGAITHHFRTVAEKPTPRQREDGTVDFRDLDLIVNVRKGEVLSTVTPPDAGTPGFTVLGVKLAQVPGRPVPFPLGRNTVFSEDETRILAACDGLAVLDGSRVQVLDTFTVNGNVGPSTGNIRFVGSVQVTGSVQQGFLVQAEGGVEIFGNVEGAFVKAGGNVVIHGGVAGQGSGKIEAGGDVKSTYFENCEISAKGSVEAESVMNSSLRCGGNMTLTGRHAKFMGGRCVAGGDIAANVVGTPAGLSTELTLGAEPALMLRHAELKQSRRDLAEQSEKLAQIVDLLAQYAAAGRLPPGKKELLESSQLSLQENAVRREQAEKEFEELDQQIAACGEGRITCRSAVYQGVKITIGLDGVEIKQPMGPTAFFRQAGQIVYTPVTY